METPKNEFVNDTWGYAKDTGSWDINIFMSESISSDSISAANARLLKYTENFLLAFSGIALPTGLSLDHLVLDDKGRGKECQEDVCLIKHRPGLDVISEIKKYMVPIDQILISAMFIDYDLFLYARTDTGKIKRLIIPEAADYYFGRLIEREKDGYIVPSDTCLSFSTVIDIWLPITRSLQEEHDNEELANLNNPLLEGALRNWEKLVGHSIDNVETSYYGDYISRYGFKKDQIEQRMEFAQT